MLLLAADGPPSGLEIDIPGKKLSASSEAIATVMVSAERMWSRSLEWAERDPIEFTLVLVLIAFIVVQRRLAKTKSVQMTIEYNERRARVRNVQLPLPLPAPPSKPED